MDCADMELNGNGHAPRGDWYRSTAQQRPRKQTVQAAKLQRLTFEAALAFQDNLTTDGKLKLTRDDATALAQLVRAWDVAADRLRVLRGRGLPASVRASTKLSSRPEPLQPVP